MNPSARIMPAVYEGRVVGVFFQFCDTRAKETVETHLTNGRRVTIHIDYVNYPIAIEFIADFGTMEDWKTWLKSDAKKGLVTKAYNFSKKLLKQLGRI